MCVCACVFVCRVCVRVCVCVCASCWVCEGFCLLRGLFAEFDRFCLVLSRESTGVLENERVAGHRHYSMQSS